MKHADSLMSKDIVGAIHDYMNVMRLPVVTSHLQCSYLQHSPPAAAAADHE